MAQATQMRGTAAAVAAFEATVRARQEEARYPQLLAGRRKVLYQRRRRSGLVAVARYHGDLTIEQHAALGQFRLDQYMLSGLYDAGAIQRRALEADPSLDELAPEAAHILVGTRDHRLLAYFCMQTATPEAGAAQKPSLLRKLFGIGEPRYLLSPGRPTFPSERELFGTAVFSSLPALRRIPVLQMRELTRLLRNQTVQSPQGVIAVVETIYAMSQLLINPKLHISVALGCMGRESRQILSNLKMPMLYAPTVPVIVPQTTPEDAYWINPSNADGIFWPFVVSTADLRSQRGYLKRLNTVLAQPASKIRRALVHLRNERFTYAPRSLIQGMGTAYALWTADPFYGQDIAHANHVDDA
jgi:hypothetical protein